MFMQPRRRRSCRFNCCMKLRSLILFSLFMGPAVFAAAPWHDGGSPFRAEFEIVTRPTQPEGGVAAQVPLCGLGFADGSDVRAFDEAGTALAILPIGESLGNTALVLFLPGPDTKRAYLYFGSKSKASRNTTAFKPSLMVDIRAGAEGSFKSWKEAEKILEKTRRLACFPVDRISLSYNPVDSDGGVFMIFDGYIRAKQAGEQTLMLVCDRAAFLFVDGKQLLAHEAQRGVGETVRGECRAAVNLSAGLHAVRAVFLTGKQPMALVGRWAGDRNKAPLGPEDFLLAGTSKLAGVEAQDSALPCPAFRCNPLSYIGYQGIQYTEVEFATLNGALADWQFGDGARYGSASFRKVFVGLGSVDVAVHQGRAEATGKVTFPQQPPPARAIGISTDFNNYSALIGQENPERLSLAVLKGYSAFLAFKELNPDLLPICAAMLKKDNLESGTRWEALRDLARAAAARKPDQAATAYETLFMDRKPPPFWREIAQEYAEFALFNRRDFKLTEQIIREIERREAVKETDAATLRFRLTLQKGDVADAKARLERLDEQAATREKRASSAIKRNALEQRFASLIQAGFLLDARRCLREWQGLAPDDWESGRLPLAWSRLWRAYEWPQGAMAELDGALALNPLLPNLPEIEFAQGELLELLGEKIKAQEAFKRIAEKYPNHPVAARARLRIR